MIQTKKTKDSTQSSALEKFDPYEVKARMAMSSVSPRWGMHNVKPVHRTGF